MSRPMTILAEGLQPGEKVSPDQRAKRRPAVALNVGIDRIRSLRGESVDLGEDHRVDYEPDLLGIVRSGRWSPIQTDCTSPRRSPSTDQTTRYSKPGRSTTTAKTNDDAGLQIRCSTVRVPRSPVVGGTKEPGDESRSSDECVREWADPGQPGRKLGVEMMAFRQYFWVDVANRGLTTVVPHEHFEWQI